LPNIPRNALSWSERDVKRMKSEKNTAVVKAIVWA
jgi:hypothetical protein